MLMGPEMGPTIGGAKKDDKKGGKFHLEVTLGQNPPPPPGDNNRKFEMGAGAPPENLLRALKRKVIDFMNHKNKLMRETETHNYQISAEQSADLIELENLLKQARALNLVTDQEVTEYLLAGKRGDLSSLDDALPSFAELFPELMNEATPQGNNEKNTEDKAPTAL